MKDVKEISIYGLADPNTGLIRYVGKTVNALNVRLNAHVWEARHTKRITAKLQWIRSLTVGPNIVLLEVVPVGADWAACERKWIEYFRSIQGCFKGGGLLNHADGGQGPHGIRQTPEHKAKIGAANKGRPPSELAKRNQHAAVAKINEEIVHEIDRLINEGMTHMAIGKRFGIDQALVTMIASRKKWSHVPRLVEKVKVPRPNDKKLTDDILPEIDRLLSSGMLHREVAARFGVSRPVISARARKLGMGKSTFRDKLSEIDRLLAEGMAQKNIAALLHVSHKSVAAHKRSLD